MYSVDEIIKNFKITKGEEDTNNRKDTVINHTRMEELIFNDKKKKIDETYKEFDYTIEDIEKKGNEKLSSFEHMSQDLFNMLYKLAPVARADEELSENVVRYNKKILERVRENSDYGPLKLITEGRDYESIEGTREFINSLYNNLDDLMKDIGGDKETQNQVDKTKQAIVSKSEQLQTNIDLFNKMKAAGKGGADTKGVESKIQSIYKQIENMEKNVRDWEQIIEGSTFKNKDDIDEKIDLAMHQALEKVNEIKDTLDSFGNQSTQTDMNIQGKSALVGRVRSNKKFREMAKILGKMRRIAKAELNREFVTGRGEKVGIEYGNNLRKVIASEFSLLANDSTKPLFYRKYIKKKLKQYKEKKREYKGKGHVICCRDESGSTKGGKEYWAKAISIALLDVAIKEKRKYADIPFGYKLGKVTEIDGSNYKTEQLLEIAESFMNDSGTAFNPPLEQAINFLEKETYDKADIVFITDGEASVDKEIEDKFNELKRAKKSKCVGILLDKGGYGSVSDKTIKGFCDVIYRTSQMAEDDIAKKVINGVV
jgi:uncharacterized protein with von Willebrand factor type A (vWA) domain